MSGQTIGKRALGIRVIDYRTGPDRVRPAGVLRYFAASSPRCPCLLGYFWMLWDKERQTWHDKLISDVVAHFRVSRSQLAELGASFADARRPKRSYARGR